MENRVVKDYFKCLVVCNNQVCNTLSYRLSPSIKVF